MYGPVVQKDAGSAVEPPVQSWTHPPYVEIRFDIALGLSRETSEGGGKLSAHLPPVELGKNMGKMPSESARRIPGRKKAGAKLAARFLQRTIDNTRTISTWLKSGGSVKPKGNSSGSVAGY